MDPKLKSFSEPQRQSSIGILVETAYSIIKLVKGYWPMFLFILYNYDNQLYKVVGLTSIIPFSIVLGYLKYRNLFFILDEEKEEFIIHSGIINKKRSVIQLNKIQQVSINQSFIQKLTHVYGIEIKTAGSMRSEAEIKAVSQPIAIALKEKLSPNNVLQFEQRDSENRKIEQPHFSIHINNLDLFKAGITSRYLESAGLLFAFFYTIINNLKDIGFIEEGAEKHFINNWSSFHVIQTSLILVISFVLIILLFNIFRIIITYYNLKITQNAHSLFVSYGLLNSKNTIINPNKVQITRVSSNYFQRKIDSFQLSIHQASSDVAMDKKANVRIPGCKKEDSNSILSFIYNQKPKKGVFLTANWRKILFPLFLFILIPIIIYSSSIDSYALTSSHLVFFIVYCALVFLFIYYSLRNYRLSIHDEFIIKKSGIWDVTEEIIEPHKIQAIRTKQYLWHRKHNIGHVILHTAGGDIRFKFANYEDINNHVNRWLYQIETSNKEWM